MHLPAASTQHLPAISPLSAHIEMEVIVMGGVIIRAEHRSKTLAGAVVDDLKETPRPVIAVPVVLDRDPAAIRSEEHTSELQSLMRISYAVFCLKKKKSQRIMHTHQK